MTLLERITALIARIFGLTGNIPPPDTTAPTITLSGPLQQITVAGPILLTAIVGDNTAVTQVTFYQGSTLLGSRSLAPWTWNATILPDDDGAVLFRAVAEDAAQNRKESLPLTVNVKIDVPDLIPPTVSLTASSVRFEAQGTLTLTAAASDNVGVTELRLERTLGGATTVIPIPPGNIVTETITPASNGELFYRLYAKDAKGNETVSEKRVVVVIGVGDTTPPVLGSLTITPSSLSQAGTVNLEAVATDNVGVAYVDFFREKNGVRTLVKREGAAPYECTSLPLTSADNGAVTFWAVVTDTSGNTDELAAQVQVSIAIPDTEKPTVSLSATPTPVTSSGPVSLSATAGDNVGVASVQFFREDTALGAPLTAPPFTKQDPVTSSTANGTYTYRVRVTDAAGNWAEDTKQVVVNLPVVQATLGNTGDAFTLNWPAVLNRSEYIVKRAYAASGREFVPVNMTTLTVNTFTDPTVYDGVMVWYRVYAVVNGVENLHASLNGIQPARVWTDAATLSSGTYTNLNIRNLNGNALTLGTTARVTLINPRIAATGHGVTGFKNYTTVRNGRLWSLMPSGAGKTHGKGVNGEEMRLMDIQDSLLEGWSSNEGKNYAGDGTAADTYIARGNIVRNVNGRRTNGSGGYQDYTSSDGNDSTFIRAQAFLFNAVNNVPGVDISWNFIHNEAGYSRVEDNINTFKSSGTASSPLNIHHNLVMGAYAALPADPRSTYFTGGGIIAGDVNSAYVNIDDNLVGDTSNYGIGIVGGNGSKARRNIVRRQPDLWNGQRNTKSSNGNVGVQFWDYNGAGPTVFRDNALDSNDVGWQYRKADGSLTRNDLYIPATVMNGANNTYTNGTQVNGDITPAMVYALYGIMRQRATAAGVSIGPSA